MVAPLNAHQDWALIGRTEELDLIDRRWASRSAGVLLAGTAGTGKSRLAKEAAARTAHEGATVVTVVATRATSSIPYAALSELVPASDHEPRWLEVLDSLRQIAADSQRLVIVVDDINHLDGLSMALIHRGVNEGLFFLVATVRSGDDVGEDVGEDVVSLWKDLSVSRIDIQALSRTQTAELVRAGLGGEVDGAAQRDIWDITAGIPLYVRELTLAALQSGALTSASGVWMTSGDLPTPGSLAELIGRRIDGLSSEATVTAEYLATVGAMGLESISGLTSLEGLRQLEDAGLATVSADPAPTARLAHPLNVDIIGAGIGVARRHEIVDRVATHIETQGPVGGEDLIRLASWRLETGDDDAALFNSAAHATYRTGDFVLAERLASRASELGDVEAALLTAQIHHERGDHEGAEAMNSQLAARVTDPADVRRTAVQRSVNLFFGLGRGAAALEMLTAIDADEMALNRAWILINMGLIDEAERVVESVKGRSDPLVWHTTAAWTQALGGDSAAAMSHIEAAMNLRSGDELPSRFRDFPQIPQVLALIGTGDLKAAEAIARHQMAVSVDRHPMFIRAWWHLLLGFISLDRGLLDDAAAEFELGGALQRRMNQPGLLRWFVAGAATARAQQRASEVAEAHLSECENITGREELLFDGLANEARAWQLASSGRAGEASQILDGAVSLATERGGRWMTERLMIAQLRICGEISPPLSDATRPLSPVLRRLIDAYSSGNAQVFAETAPALEEMGVALAAAETWSKASLGFRSAGDQRAANHAANAASAAASLCQGPQTPGLVAERSVTPLTHREREVISLAARGLPSKEIATSLNVSIRTVNNQIQRAYLKLGVSSRAEAADALGIGERSA